MEPCQEICAVNAKQFVENGSYQKFIAESQGSAGKTVDFDAEPSKVLHDSNNQKGNFRKKIPFTQLGR